MHMSRSILFGILELFILFGLGFLARKLKLIDDDTIGSMSKVIFDMLFPVLIFGSIVKDFNPGRLGELWPLPCIGFGLMVLGGAAAFLLEKGLRTREEDVKRTFRHLCAVNNFAFLPIILLQRIIGDQGVASLFFLNVGSNLAFWTLGIGLLGKGGSLREVLKQLITPTLAAIILALALSLSGLGSRIPLFVLDLFKKTGNASVQIMLVLIGASWVGLSFSKDVWNQAFMAFTRLILLPGISVFLINLLKLPRDVFLVSVIVAIMPVSSQSPIITRRYGGSPGFASKATIVTTLASAITIPVWLLLLT